MATTIEIKNENVEKFKEHVKKYKEAYITAGVSLAVITCLIVRGSHAALRGGAGCPEKEPVDSLNFFHGKSVFGSVTNSAVTTIHKGAKGNPGFETQGDAAKFFGIPEQFMSEPEKECQ